MLQVLEITFGLHRITTNILFSLKFKNHVLAIGFKSLKSETCIPVIDLPKNIVINHKFIIS